MPLLLRKLNKATWWDKPDDDDDPFIGADAFKNVSTTQNRLSIFVVENECTALDITVALQAGAKHNEVVDYCLFDSEIVQRLEIEQERVDGKTPLAHVNARHIDMKTLSAKKLHDFVTAAVVEGECFRTEKRQVEARLRELHANGTLDTVHSDEWVKKLVGA